MPKLRWHPVTGENQTFADDESAPEGWLDYHPADPAHEPPAAVIEPAAPVVAPDKVLTRKELIEALNEGAIAFDANAKVADLDGVLKTALVAALTNNKVEFKPEASTRELLALVRAL